MTAKLTDDFGPAMLALDERARKFVLAIVWRGKNQMHAAREAGYASKTDDYLRVQGHRLTRQVKVIAALREESERRFGASIPLALVSLCDDAQSKSRKVRGAAIDSLLDRAGYGRTVKQDIRVEHVDSRSTEDLLKLVQQFAPKLLEKPIEGEFKEVKSE